MATTKIPIAKFPTGTIVINAISNKNGTYELESTAVDTLLNNYNNAERIVLKLDNKYYYKLYGRWVATALANTYLFIFNNFEERINIYINMLTKEYSVDYSIILVSKAIRANYAEESGDIIGIDYAEGNLEYDANDFAILEKDYLYIKGVVVALYFDDHDEYLYLKSNRVSQTDDTTYKEWVFSNSNYNITIYYTSEDETYGARITNAQDIEERLVALEQAVFDTVETL